MMFDVMDTLYESFYAYTEWAIEEDARLSDLQPAIVGEKREWTEEEEAIARHTTVLLAS